MHITCTLLGGVEYLLMALKSGITPGKVRGNNCSGTWIWTQVDHLQGALAPYIHYIQSILVLIHLNTTIKISIFIFLIVL